MRRGKPPRVFVILLEGASFFGQSKAVDALYLRGLSARPIHDLFAQEALTTTDRKIRDDPPPAHIVD